MIRALTLIAGGLGVSRDFKDYVPMLLLLATAGIFALFVWKTRKSGK